jgi:hypothetical protein
MVDSHTIAVGTVTLMGVALFIGSMTAVINATSRLLQAASRLIKTVGLFLKSALCLILDSQPPEVFKKTHCITSGDSFLKNPSSSALLNIFKKTFVSYFSRITTSSRCLGVAFKKILSVNISF